MGDGDVTFTVKELIGRLDVKMDLLLDEVRGKADSSEVKDLNDRVTSLEMAHATAKSALNTTRFLCITAAPAFGWLAAHFTR